jgi:L-amino acid N-acyltransferase YncA
MRALTKKMFAAVSSTPLFFARNLYCGIDLNPFTLASFGGFAIEPLSTRHLAAVDDLYAALNRGARLGLQKMALLHLLGSRLCLVARRAGSDEVVGMVVYYFNARDRRDGTVHEGYIGLREADRSGGLGTFMRRHALQNFARSGLRGVSSRISVSNAASLKSNRKLGFVPVETYFDATMGEERHYLICDLRGNDDLLQSTKRTVR